WSRIAAWTAAAIGAPLLLLYAFAAGYPEVAPQIPWMDRQEVWLFLPLLAWGTLLMIGLAAKTASAPGRWLAGSIGYETDNRRWVMLCAVPLLILLAAAWIRLGDTASSYPAAHWSTTALLSLTLLRVGWSRPRRAAA